MYLMEGKRLLDANVLDGRQEIAKPIFTNIAVPWIFEIFFLSTLLYITEVKNMHCATSFCRKKTANLIERMR